MRPTSPTGADRRPAALPAPHDRAAILSILGLGAGAWALVIWSAVNLDAPVVRAMMPMTEVWSWQSAVAVWAMWAVMMAAMMLPSAAPMIVVHRRIARKDDDGAAANACFIAAYLTAWAAFSLAAAGAQWGLQALGVLSHMLVVVDDWLAAAILIGAGLYQFAPLKDACLAKCRTPFGFLVTDWRPGNVGAFRMGLKHGSYCIGCCWAMMAVLFVLGVMNLWAIGLLATAVAAEKLLPWGPRPRWLLGAALIAWGAALPLV